MPELSALYSSFTVQELMRAVVTICAFVLAAFVILSPRYEPKDKQWACGLIGTILGYWLSK